MKTASHPETAILVIDDDAVNLAIVTDYLGGAFTILVAEDGEKGIARAEYAKPDLILLDVMMPGIDGFETCRRLKANPATRDIPVIFMTALADVEHKVKGFQAGAVDYLPKPVQKEEIQARVAVHLRLAELTERLTEANELLERRVEERTRELRESERELRQAQKMEAIGTLAAGIAHDFNNILAAIVGFTEVALHKMPQEIPGREQMNRVLESTQRASELVQQILIFSRMREQERRALHLIPIVDDACRLLRSSLPATIEMVKEHLLPPDSDTVLANHTQMHQVLMNLCTNAAHAMRLNGGVLRIALSEVADGDLPPVDPPHPACGRYLRLSVSDTGHGIHPDNLDKIFDPYFTTKGAGEGTGLGLAVVRGIVKNHGGAIEVKSEKEKGTTFNIYLPAVAAEVHLPEEKAQEVPLGTEHVLLVDDEELLVEMAQELLQALGYRVTATTSSVEALEIFTRDAEAFDLVMTDLTMPALTGRDLAVKIATQKPGMPILLCTGYDESIDGWSRACGIRECLLKPYTMEHLARAVRRALE